MRLVCIAFTAFTVFTPFLLLHAATAIAAAIAVQVCRTCNTPGGLCFIHHCLKHCNRIINHQRLPVQSEPVEQLDSLGHPESEPMEYIDLLKSLLNRLIKYDLPEIHHNDTVSKRCDLMQPVLD